MKRTPNTCILILLVTIAMMAGSCLKPSDSDLIRSETKPVTTEVIVKILAGRQDLSLFNKAFLRAGANFKLSLREGATIFAPDNAAMQAAGYNEAGINNMPLAELAKMVNYHLLHFALSPQGIASRTLTMPVETLRQDTTYTPGVGNRRTAPLLYVSGRDKLIINDEEAGGLTQGIAAANGYIYPVSRVLRPTPEKKMIDVLENDPELSLFRAALWIADSLRQEAVLQWENYNEDQCADLWFFTRDIDYTVGSTPGGLPSVIAPTNAAFAAAGFYTEDDIRTLAHENPVRVDVDWNIGAYLVYHSTLDSILRMHLFTSPVFYSDMLYGELNNNRFNNYIRMVNDWGLHTILKFPFRPLFSVQNGQAYAQWKNDPAAKAAVYKYPGNGSITRNGTIYFTDQLFYTPR